MIPPNASFPDPAPAPSESGSNPPPPRPALPAPLVGLPAVGQRPGAPVPPPVASGPDFQTLLKAMGRRWPLAVGLGLLAAVAAGLAAWFLLPPRYTGFALLRVNFFQPTIQGRSPGDSDGRTEFDSYKRLQMANLRRRDVLNDTLKKDQVKRMQLLQGQAEPLTWLEDQLKVESKEGSEIVQLDFVGPDPDEAVQLVHAVVESYDNLVVRKEQEAREDRVFKLQTLATQARTKLDTLRKTLAQNRQKIAVGDKEAQKQNLQLLLADYGVAKQKRGEVQSRLDQAQLNLAKHQANEKTATTLRVSELELTQALDNNPQIRQLQERISKVQEILATDGPKYRDQNASTLKNLRTMKANLEKTLADRRDQLVKELTKKLETKSREDYNVALNQLKAEVDYCTDEKKRLSEEVGRLDREIRSLGIIQNGQDELVEDIHQQERLVEDLIGKQNVLEIEAKAAPRVTVWQPAGLQKVDLKRRILAAGGGGVGMLFLVCFGVGWWEHPGRRIQSTDEVTTGLGMRVVGSVPAMSGSALGRFVANVNSEDVNENNLVESMDAIRTMLLRDATLQATRVLMVTSAVAGEGKTTLACNLATSLARAGRKTLLIDCDLRCPAAHQMFEQTLQPGFSELLLGEVDLVDAIRPTTAIDGLWFIPAGQWDREVLQGLARPGVQDIFDRLKEEFDFIVIDSHPVLRATDSLLLGQHVDAVIFALMKDISQTPRVQTAGQRLADLGIRVLGAVVNGIPADAFASGGPVPAHAAR